MRYTDFKSAIQNELRRRRDGMTWAQLQQKLKLPYDRPCPAWTRQLEEEIGVMRTKGVGRALVWRIAPGE